IVQEFQNLDADRFYTITESRKSSGQPYRESRRKRVGGPRFARSARVRGIKHTAAWVGVLLSCRLLVHTSRSTKPWWRPSP
ncbi:MAG: hypothetical protein ACE10G_13025, partial [Gemmatimonadales bacterium]